MRSRNIKMTASVLFIFIATVCGLAQRPGPYHILRTMELGGDGSWDYLRFDGEGKRLFIARSTRVMVVDLASGKVTGEIADTAGVHGVALVPALGRGFTSNGKANTATIFDLGTLKPAGSVTTGEKPDAILWEPFSKTVMTMNGHSNSITVIEPQAAKAIATIALPGRPESAVSDEKGMMFVNLEDKGEIAVIDVAQRAVLHSWPLAGCTEPTGLAIDLERRRLFAGCHSGVLVVVNADTGENVQKLPIGQGVDAVSYDPGKRTVISSNGEGTLSIIDQAGANEYRNRETVATLAGAKTMALDPINHLVYTVANRDGKFVLLEIGR